jgi:cytochrome bd-type quinol oxidase subunit 2
MLLLMLASVLMLLLGSFAAVAFGLVTLVAGMPAKHSHGVRSRRREILIGSFAITSGVLVILVYVAGGVLMLKGIETGAADHTAFFTEP